MGNLGLDAESSLDRVLVKLPLVSSRYEKRVGSRLLAKDRIDGFYGTVSNPGAFVSRQ